jgi:hypothetical protein
MVNSRGFARLATLAVGLGIGVAVAFTPGVARADDLQISIDGMDLFSTVGNSATAYSGSGDIAIAYGDGSYASAQGGSGDFALADGSDAYATAGGRANLDTGADHDTAIDIGNNTGAYDDGAFAGNADLDGRGAGGNGSGDTAIDIGNNSGATDGSFAGAGGLLGVGGSGNDDTAIDVGNNSSLDDGSGAVGGNDNFAGVLGGNSESWALLGSNDVAGIVGPNSVAYALEGNHDVAYVFDPSGTDGSTAYAGVSGNSCLCANSDLSAVFGDGLYSDYTRGGSDLYDIMTQSGDFPGSVGPLLAELLSLF